jgi:hypothetical protein
MDGYPLSLSLGRMFPTRPTGYIHIAVSLRERGPFVFLKMVQTAFSTIVLFAIIKCDQEAALRKIMPCSR